MRPHTLLFQIFLPYFNSFSVYECCSLQYWHPKFKPIKPGFLPAHKPGFMGLKIGGFTRVFGYPGCIPYVQCWVVVVVMVAFWWVKHFLLHWEWGVTAVHTPQRRQRMQEVLFGNAWRKKSSEYLANWSHVKMASKIFCMCIYRVFIFEVSLYLNLSPYGIRWP